MNNTGVLSSYHSLRGNQLELELSLHKDRKELTESDIEHINHYLRFTVIKLTINNWAINDFSWLSNFDKLEEISVLRGNMNSLSDLDGGYNIKELSLTNTKLKDLKGIEKYKNLQCLDLEGTKLKKLDCQIPELRYLNIGHTSVTHISDFLKHSKKLDKVLLWGSEIDSHDIVNVIEGIHTTKLKQYALDVIVDGRKIKLVGDPELLDEIIYNYMRKPIGEGIQL